MRRDWRLIVIGGACCRNRLFHRHLSFACALGGDPHHPARAGATAASAARARLISGPYKNHSAPLSRIAFCSRDDVSDLCADEIRSGSASHQAALLAVATHFEELMHTGRISPVKAKRWRSGPPGSLAVKQPYIEATNSTVHSHLLNYGTLWSCLLNLATDYQILTVSRDISHVDATCVGGIGVVSRALPE
jgi:hypothetical protein